MTTFSSTIIPRDVTSQYSQNQQVAKDIQTAYANGGVFDVTLGGKYSQGLAIAIVNDDKAYLLKPESSRNSPAAGVSDFPDLSKTDRESAFADVAHFLGVGEVPKAYSIKLDGHSAAAIELLPADYIHVGSLKKHDMAGLQGVFQHYKTSGQLWRWCFLDYFLGNTDRHSNNLLVDPDTDKVALIDHGGSLAGPSFNPADPKTFTPYYLRYNSNHFAQKSPLAKFESLEKPSSEEEDGFKNWLRHHNQPELWSFFSKYQIPEQAFKDRFEQVLLANRPITYMLRKWCGL